MNKILKKIAVLALTGTMTLGMSVNVLAEGETPTRNDASKFTVSGATANSGIGEFYLIKDYDSFNPTGNAPKSQSPAEKFTYEITPYGVWNAGSTYSNVNGTGTATPITTANMPMLLWKKSDNDVSGSTGEGASRKLTVTQSVNKAAASFETTPDMNNASDNKVTIKLPTYATVGDYWYKVEEKIGIAGTGSTYNPTTGVFYGTNSLLNDINNSSTTDTKEINGKHTAIYYIHVQVTESDLTVDSGKTSRIVSNVTMHTIAPGTIDDVDKNLSDADTDNNNKVSNAEYNTWTGTDGNYAAGKKVNAIENRYYAGDLVIRKEVTGNAGDKDAYYPITVVFTKDAGTVVNSDIEVTGGFKLSGTQYTQTPFTIYGQYSTEESEEYTKIKWTQGANKVDEATATCTFYVTDDTTVTFSNIPYGIKYVVTEDDQSANGYTHSFAYDKDINGASAATTAETGASFNGKSSLNDTATQESDTGTASAKWQAANATGYITDARDIVTVINEKNTTIDIGVITSNAPYIAMLAFVAAALVLFVNRRKNIFEE